MDPAHVRQTRAVHLRRLRSAVSLLAFGLLLLAPSGCSGKPERPGIPPRHILLLTLDGVRPDHLSGYGHAWRTTFLPTDPMAREEGRSRCIDDLMADGVSFAAAFAPLGRTLPALVALHCGRPPESVGVGDDAGVLSAEVPTLAQRLGAAGFATYAFVSQPDVELGPALARGFDVFEQSVDDHAALAAAYGWVLEHDFGNDRPVLLWLHLSGPLPPFPTEGTFAPHFVDATATGGIGGTLEELARLHRGEITAEPAVLARLAALYDADLAETNLLLARFLDRFQFVTTTSGAWTRTLTVLAGTRGLELGERHGYCGSARSLHDAALRVPLALRHPDSLTGSRVLDEIVELTDVVPTLLDWFDLPTDGSSGGPLPGRSLLSLVDSYVRRPFESRPAFTRTPEGILTVRTPRWRLIENPGDREVDGAYPVPAVALYDHALGADADVDVSAAHSDVVVELGAELRRFVESAGADR